MKVLECLCELVAALHDNISKRGQVSIGNTNVFGH